MHLEALAVDLGSYPLSATDLSTRRLTPAVCLNGILSLIEFGNLVGPLALSALYLRQIIRKAIPQYISGGEPAITGFDWPFTPIHKSSGTFSAVGGSGPPQGFYPLLQPAHG